MASNAGKAARALERLREEAETYANRLEEYEKAEEMYLRRWAALVSNGEIKGKNAEERRAQEVSLLEDYRMDRLNARVALRRAEIWYELAKRQADIFAS